MQNKINKMNRKISLEENLGQDDTIGGFANNWVLIKEVWASIDNQKFETIYNNIKLETRITHIITIRYFNIINTSMRIKYKEQLFTIKYINNIDNKVYELLVEELL